MAAATPVPTLPEILSSNTDIDGMRAAGWSEVCFLFMRVLLPLYGHDLGKDI